MSDLAVHWQTVAKHLLDAQSSALSDAAYWKGVAEAALQRAAELEAQLKAKPDE